MHPSELGQQKGWPALRGVLVGPSQIATQHAAAPLARASAKCSVGQREQGKENFLSSSVPQEHES